MFKRKILIILITFLLVINFNLNIFAGEIEENTDYVWLQEEILATSSSNILEPNISSKCAIALDRNSKTVLWGKNENTKVPMASTTKIMTSIILLEAIEKGYITLDTTIEACKEAANIGGSRLGLKIGDKISINDLMYGLMLCSGNDCAIQIAVSIAGDIENFAKLMNYKAKKLGLENTQFVTPHGLDKANHYTTAYELALMTDYALNIEKFGEVVNTKSYSVLINGYNKNISNTNELLGFLEGVNGVKTGFTNEAGRCLVTSVNRDGFNIITVILGANTKKIRTKDSICLIEYVYKNYEIIDLRNIIQEEFNKWREINEKRIYVNKGKKRYIKTYLQQDELNELNKYPIKKENIKEINIKIENIKYIEAPLHKDTIIGELNIFIGKVQIIKIDIKLNETIEKKKIKEYFIQLIENILKLGIEKSHNCDII